jgi:hypothetical protein
MRQLQSSPQLRLGIVGHAHVRRSLSRATITSTRSQRIQGSGLSFRAGPAHRGSNLPVQLLAGLTRPGLRTLERRVVLGELAHPGTRSLHGWPSPAWLELHDEEE